jgi:hypothetical protein
MNAPSEALAAIEPVPFSGSRVDCDLRTVQAIALWRLNRFEESRRAAVAAIAAASSYEIRERVRGELEFIVGPTAAF